MYAPEFDHKHPESGAVYAVMMRHPQTGLFVEIRDTPSHAEKQRNRDPVTWAVRSEENLEEFRHHFEKLGVEHSKVFKGVQD